MSKEFKRGDRVFAIRGNSIIEARVLHEAKTDPMGGPCYRLEAGYRFRPMIKADKIFRTYEEAEEYLQREQNADIWPHELHDTDEVGHWI